VVSQFLPQDIQVNVTVTGKRYGHHIGYALAPGQFIGMVLIGSHKHNGALLTGNILLQLVAMAQVCWKANIEYVYQFVDRRSGAGTAKNNLVIFRSIY